VFNQRILQMPKESDDFANKPFRDVPRNTVSKAS